MSRGMSSSTIHSFAGEYEEGNIGGEDRRGDGGMRGGWLPSMLRKEMEGISLLPTYITWRRPLGGEGGGEFITMELLMQ